MILSIYKQGVNTAYKLYVFFIFKFFCRLLLSHSPTTSFFIGFYILREHMLIGTTVLTSYLPPTSLKPPNIGIFWYTSIKMKYQVLHFTTELQLNLFY